MIWSGQEIYQLAGRLFPICRSITGNGVRKTLAILKEYYPDITLYEVPSGTPVYDWTVPKEWNINGGYIADSSGQHIIDFADNDLHVMGYSVPVDRYVTLSELKEHLYTEPTQPDVIPYVTSYYKERFGFCMSENQKNSLKDDTYHMVIDSSLTEGSLTYGEIKIPGDSSEEIFLSTYICHPSMANNECSGPALAVALACWISSLPRRRYSYRIVFIPETIGSITYLSRNLTEMKQNIIAGFNLSCVGDANDYSIVRSRYGNTLADRALKNVLKYHCPDHTDYSFLTRGSDERQYNAPGVDLPVVCFCRSKFGNYPEYHTSADNMEFVSPEGFAGSFDVMRQVILALENNYKYRIKVLCEPQLGKRGLYPTVSQKGVHDSIFSMRDLIAYADGTNDLIDISDRIGCPVRELIPIIEKLTANHLLEAAENPEEIL